MIACPHCQLSMHDAPELAGQTVACPSCNGAFVVPEELFDPYHTWLGIPPSEQPPHFYRLLGLQLFESNQAVIDNAADRQMKHLHAFQAGSYAAASQSILNEVANARVTLLDPRRKTPYDQQLLRAIASSQRAAADQLASSTLIQPPPPAPSQPPARRAPVQAVFNSNAPSASTRGSVRRPARRPPTLGVTSAVHIAWIILG